MRMQRETLGEGFKRQSAAIAAVMALGVAIAGWFTTYLNQKTLERKTAIAQKTAAPITDLKAEVKSNDFESNAAYKALVENNQQLKRKIEALETASEWQTRTIDILIGQLSSAGVVRRARVPKKPNLPAQEFIPPLPRTPEAAAAQASQKPAGEMR